MSEAEDAKAAEAAAAAGGAAAAAGGADLAPDTAHHGADGAATASQPHETVSLACGSDGWGFKLSGGSPHCPCVYPVQITRSDTPFEVGDEIVMINEEVLIGKTIEEVGDLLDRSRGGVKLTYRRLPATPTSLLSLKSADLTFKKLKQRITSKMKPETLNLLGIKRAALAGETTEFDEQIAAFDETTGMYTQLVKLTELYLRHFRFVSEAQSGLGALMTSLQAEETQPTLGQLWQHTGTAQTRSGEMMMSMFGNASKACEGMSTFLSKAIPDCKASQKQLEDARYEYLAYSLRVQALADKEQSAKASASASKALQTGNYDYRTTLRDCVRHRALYEKARENLAVKLKLLDTKHAQDMCAQLSQVTQLLQQYHSAAHTVFAEGADDITALADAAQEQCRALQ